MQISMQPGAGRLPPASRMVPAYTNPVPLPAAHDVASPALVGRGSALVDGSGPDQVLADDTAAQTEALGSELKAALNQAFIGTDQPIRLSVSRFGTVETTDGRKERIEQFFRDRPELSKKLKDVSALNTLVAMNKLYRWHEAQQKAARTDGERDSARDRFNAASLQLQSLSGTATLQDGRLRFAVQDFADTLVAGT